MDVYQDKSLQRRITLGDRKAFDDLYTKYQNELITYGLKICNDIDLVQDCLQDLFLTLWSSRLSIDNINFIKIYLFKSLKRAIVKRITRERKLKNLSPHDLLEENHYLSNESEIINNERESEVSEVLSLSISKLSKRQKEVVNLKYYHDLEYNEIANSMEVNYQSVINHVHKSINKLRKCTFLKEYRQEKIAS